MYKKNSHSWLKHSDFILLDCVCQQIAFIIAYLIRHGLSNPYESPLYYKMAIFAFVSNLAVAFFNESYANVVKRGYYIEFMKTMKHSSLVEGMFVLFLFFMKAGSRYSRFVLFATWIIYVLISYIVRIAWKYHLKNNTPREMKNSLLIVTTEALASSIIKNIRKESFLQYVISGLVILDRDMTGERIKGIPVVATEETTAKYICRHWIDEVFINVPSDVNCSQELIDDITEMGITVHVNLTELSDVRGKRQLVEKIGDYTVLTTSINYMTPREALMKRLLDILGGLVGCFFTIIILVIVGPFIYFASPGPIFFSQIRVGKNGKKFRIYKFRSMYMDAEKRKKELMDQNRISDGLMFKMDFDPRIIGNEITKDGKQKTGIGDFIRRTSLDEFPQFFNVLKGEMSLVGTRPPTVDEWEHYELHHRARLATKPGITGMWQVSGRSKITDFEEVVKLDTTYINEWNMGLDLKILFKTILVVFTKDGSM